MLAYNVSARWRQLALSAQPGHRRDAGVANGDNRRGVTSSSHNNSMWPVAP